MPSSDQPSKCEDIPAFFQQVWFTLYLAANPQATDKHVSLASNGLSYGFAVSLF